MFDWSQVKIFDWVSVVQSSQLKVFLFNWSSIGWVSVVPSSLSSPSRSSVSWQSQSESVYFSLYFSICICLCIFLSVYVFVFFYLYIYLYLSFFICICICQCLGRAVPGSHKVSPPTAVEGHCRLFLVVHLDAPTNHHPPTHWPPQPPYPDMENVANMENICVQFFSSCAFRCSHHPPTARGGRWTSLDASFARCFAIFWNIVKTSHR